MSLLAIGTMVVECPAIAYYLLMHIFYWDPARRCCSLGLRADFGPVGVGSDSWFSTAMIVKFKRHWVSQDFGC
ncbi:MAG: hypothetical protein U0176_24510 [Bacteroidia bacterium]